MFSSHHNRFPKRATVCFAGTGIAGLAGLTEISLRFPDWNIVAFTDRHLLENSSASSYAILGGNGCFSAVKPRSRFRSLMQNSLHKYLDWLDRHGEKGIASPLKEIHLHNTACPQSHSALKTLQHLCTQEGNKPNIEKNIPALLGTALSNAFYSYFKQSRQNGQHRDHAPLLSGLAFNCSMHINPHTLMSQLCNTLCQRGVFFMENASLQSFKTNADGVSLEVKTSPAKNHFANEDHRLKTCCDPLDHRSFTHKMNCQTLIIASGHANAQMASENGLRLKTHSNWAMWLGFSKSQLPKSIQNFYKDLETSLLIKFNGHSLLLHKEKKGNTIAMAMSTMGEKIYWGTSPQVRHFDEVKKLWLALFGEKMPTPTVQHSGYRTRSTDWLPHIGWLPHAKQKLPPVEQQGSLQIGDHKATPPTGVLLLGSFYKSGITMAPIIAEMCANALGKKQQQKKQQGVPRHNDADSLAKFHPLLQPTRKDGVRFYNHTSLAAGGIADHCLNYPFHCSTSSSTAFPLLSAF